MSHSITRCASLALLVALAPQETPAQAPASAAAPAQAEPTPAATARDWSVDSAPDELPRALASLAARADGALALSEIGTSRGGRPIELAELGRVGAGPSLLVCTDLESELPGGRIAGPDAALFVLEELVLRRTDDAPFAGLLERVGLAVVLLADPDPVAPAAAPAVNLNRNFPAGWQPWPAPGEARLGSPGPYPLSEPEALALARHLVLHPEIACLVVLSRRQGAAADEPGSLARFASRTLGMEVLVLDAWDGARVETPRGSAPAGFVAAARRVAELCGELPRLEVSPATVERLRADLWQVEIALEGSGALYPKVDALPPPRRAAARLELVVEGAELELVGLRPAGQRAFLPVGEEALAEALARRPGERLELRLALRAPEGSSVRLALQAALAGRGETRVELR